MSLLETLAAVEGSSLIVLVDVRMNNWFPLPFLTPSLKYGTINREVLYNSCSIRGIFFREGWGH